MSSGAGLKVTRFDLSYDGIGDVLRSDETRRELTSRAERVLAAAQAGAPVVTGEYQHGLHLEQITTDRAVVRVAGSTSYDWFVEAETGNLSRSLDQAR